ncbi:MAG: MFS transporter, partial [Dehalococcoidia bacterium]
MVAAFAVLHGIAWGARGPLMQAIRADYFGRSSYGAIMGTSSLVVTAGTVAGPVVAGVMADRFGSYHIGFTVLAVLAALGCAFWVFAGRPAPPRRASEALPA